MADGYAQHLANRLFAVPHLFTPQELKMFDYGPPRQPLVLGLVNGLEV
jgi:hypothetical protein